jgi:hypothetical protein
MTSSCHGPSPLFLQTRARGSGVGIPHVLLAVAQRLRSPSSADRAIEATPTSVIARQDQPIERTEASTHVETLAENEKEAAPLPKAA